MQQKQNTIGFKNNRNIENTKRAIENLTKSHKNDGDSQTHTRRLHQTIQAVMQSTTYNLPSVDRRRHRQST